LPGIDDESTLPASVIVVRARSGAPTDPWRMSCTEIVSDREISDRWKADAVVLSMGAVYSLF